MSLDRPSVDPSAIGEFISFDGCSRYHKFRFTDYAAKRSSERNWREAFEPLSLLFAKDGDEFEQTVVDEVSRFAASVETHEEIEDWTCSRETLADAFDATAAHPPSDRPRLFLQSRLGLRIEAWPVAGDANILTAWPTEVGVRIRVLDIKAAHEEKTYHQIQVGVYTILLRQFLTDHDPDYDWEVEGGVITRETTLTSAAPDELPAFDVFPQEFDVRTLLEEDGRFDDLHRQAPETVGYQIGSKCESCAYKEACFTDALEEFSTATLGMSIGDQNRLADHGIETVRDLAELAFPEQEARPYDYDTELMPRRDLFEDLQNDPELGPEIHHYVQRAHAMLGDSHGRGPHASSGDGAPPYLIGSGDGSLPADDPPYETTDLPVARGDLIRIYPNVQHDNRRDRVVMCAGYVTATNYAENGGEPYHLSEIAPDLSMDSDASLREERRFSTASGTSSLTLSATSLRHWAERSERRFMSICTPITSERPGSRRRRWGETPSGCARSF